MRFRLAAIAVAVAGCSVAGAVGYSIVADAAAVDAAAAADYK